MHESQLKQRSMFRLFQTVDGSVVPTQINKILRKQKLVRWREKYFFTIITVKVTPIPTPTRRCDNNLEAVEVERNRQAELPMSNSSLLS